MKESKIWLGLEIQKKLFQLIFCTVSKYSQQCHSLYESHNII